MQQYTIAGHPIQVSGEGLDTLPGFDSFLSDKTSCEPLLAISEKTSVEDWAISPFFTFKNEKAFYDLSAGDNAYLCRLKLPEDNYLLAEIRREGISFQAAVRQKGFFNKIWLRSVCELLFNIASLSRQTVSIHASAVMIHGKSTLFLGESGTGKSTHSRLWLNHLPGTELLNDDRPLIKVEADGSVRVYGSPWSGKTPCYKNMDAPVAAFVRLSQAPHNRIRRLKGAEAIGALLPSLSVSLIYDKNLSESIYSIVSQTLLRTPVYHLECLPDAGAVDLVYSTLLHDRIYEGCDTGG